MKLLSTLILFSLAVIPGVTLAQGQEPDNFLVGIPGIGDPSGNFDGYIQAIYAMFISIAALLAVVKIVIAGVKYMFSDIITQKSQAKKDIQGALLGLVVVLGAVLILTVINPELTNFNIEQNRVAVPEQLTPEEVVSTFEEGCAASEFCRIINCQGGPALVMSNSVCNQEILDCNNSGRTGQKLSGQTIMCRGSVTNLTDRDDVFTLKQNADQIAAGEDPVEITLLSDTVDANGMISIQTPSGEQTVSCGAVVPSVCN